MVKKDLNSSSHRLFSLLLLLLHNVYQFLFSSFSAFFTSSVRFEVYIRLKVILTFFGQKKDLKINWFETKRLDELETKNKS